MKLYHSQWRWLNYIDLCIVEWNDDVQETHEFLFPPGTTKQGNIMEIISNLQNKGETCIAYLNFCGITEARDKSLGEFSFDTWITNQNKIENNHMVSFSEARRAKKSSKEVCDLLSSLSYIQYLQEPNYVTYTS